MNGNRNRSSRIEMDYSRLSMNQIEICDKLRKFKVPSMAKALAEQFSNPNNELSPFIERMRDIVDAEFQSRAERKFRRMLDDSKLKYPDATFDEKLNMPDRKIDCQLVSRLCECNWVKEAKILSITGATGTGKSYLACAFGISAMHKGFTVRYYFMQSLINMLKRSSETNTMLEFMNGLDAVDLLIIDDFGYTEEKGQKKKVVNYHRLFEVLNAREGRRATIIAAQLDRTEWYELFDDDICADACMDRITKGNYILELDGPSLR
ncbi:MAG: ATP-binding protein [Sphaerochaetaceae bacterium]|jgi:DNA replication protein DnaC|nr:ATP-binding protein [Sphaerochaetaceae bacterium]MDD3164173.1 ATP-binding protein [Sphaerochaetaceae bacterium]MDD4006683.1 ATP-binding protein [Sphaerochaetaceae bacterium]MDD4397833.1 ATP-binding protein [Sphaerochaetaceae bacterium]